MRNQEFVEKKRIKIYNWEIYAQRKKKWLNSILNTYFYYKDLDPTLISKTIKNKNVQILFYKNL